MATRNYRVGLTGGIASGKSTAAKFFGALGVPILDSDQIARDVVEPGQPPLERLVERFGPKILTPDGHLDRPALRDIVFSDPKARADLEALTHPAIGAAMEARSASAGGPYQILVVPLLVEKNLSSHVDRVLVVDCDEELQMRRLRRGKVRTRSVSSGADRAASVSLGRRSHLRPPRSARRATTSSSPATRRAPRGA